MITVSTCPVLYFIYSRQVLYLLELSWKEVVYKGPTYTMLWWYVTTYLCVQKSNVSGEDGSKSPQKCLILRL